MASYDGQRQELKDRFTKRLREVSTYDELRSMLVEMRDIDLWMQMKKPNYHMVGALSQIEDMEDGTVMYVHAGSYYRSCICRITNLHRYWVVTER
jgi:hypothetical protein